MKSLNETLGRKLRARTQQEMRWSLAEGVHNASRPVVLLPMALMAIAGLGASVGAGDRAREFYAANGALVLVAIFLYWHLDRRSPGRPVGLVRVAILIQSVAAIMLILGTLLEGNLQYGTADGLYSYLDGAARVAAVNLLFMLTLYLPALLLGTEQRKAPLPASLDEVSPRVVDGLLAATTISLIFRAVLLFLPAGAVPVPAYFMRVLIGMLLPTVFFVGVAYHRRTVMVKGIAAFVAAVAVLTVLSGIRLDAIMLLLIASLGYVAGRPMKRFQLWLLAGVGGLVIVGVLLVGQALREDGLGRTGQAALERMGNIGDQVSESEANRTAVESTIGRLISTSTHSILTRVPEEMPFEEDGLLSIPTSLVASFLPRLNWEGVSSEEIPRNWILNRLGFMVNWQTSVELTLLADAWYRAGWLGVVLIGLCAGLLLQWSENVAYSMTSRRPEAVLVLISVVVFLPVFLGRDIVAAVRGLIFNLGAMLLLMMAVRPLNGVGRRRTRANDAPAHGPAKTH